MDVECKAAIASKLAPTGGAASRQVSGLQLEAGGLQRILRQLPNKQPQQLRLAANAQLGVDVLAVNLHRAGADVQLFGH
ncbi:hypothetical protein D3C81_1829840 [compost metagenome]